MITHKSIFLLEYLLGIIMTEGNYQIYRDCIFVNLDAQDICITLSEMEDVVNDVEISSDTRDIVKKVIKEIKKEGGKA